MSDYEAIEQYETGFDDTNPASDHWLGRKWSLFLWSLLVLLIIVLMWPYIVVNIGPGHVGVLYRRFLGGTEMNYIFKEGTHSIFPWDKMYVYDAKLQEESYTLHALNKLGLNIELDVTIIFKIIQQNAPLLQTTVGIDYKTKIIKPMVLSTVVDIVSKHVTEDFFNENLSHIKDEMLVNMISMVGRLPLEIDNILIRKVRVPEALSQAINDKLVAEQRIHEKRFLVLQAVEAFKKAYVEANAVSVTQQIVNPNLTERFLTWQGIEATKSLAANPNSKVVIIGNNEGLPLILNLDSSSKDELNEPTKDAASPEPQALERFLERLEKLDANKLENFVKPLFDPLINPKLETSPPQSANSSTNLDLGLPEPQSPPIVDPSFDQETK
jgi:regulator of protease activity HflC (stomatin/prohibitin superfamily)